MVCLSFVCSVSVILFLKFVLYDSLLIFFLIFLHVWCIILIICIGVAKMIVGGIGMVHAKGGTDHDHVCHRFQSFFLDVFTLGHPSI